MKKIILKLTLFAAFAILTASCKDDSPNFYVPDNAINPGDEGDLVDGYGYISFDGLGVDIEQTIVSKAGEEEINTDDYIIEIVNKDKLNTIYKRTYAEAKSESDPIKVVAGNYSITARSFDQLPETAWNAPQYHTTQDFAVGGGSTTTIYNLICRLSYAEVKIEMSKDLMDLFLSDEECSSDEEKLEVGVNIAGNALTYSQSKIFGADKGYFAIADDESETLRLSLKGKYNAAVEGEAPNYVMVEGWSESIPNVEAGQSRLIKINVENYDEGQIQISFTVQSWVLDSPIGVQTSQFFALASEKAILDVDELKSEPLSPIITLDGGLDISKFYKIENEDLDPLLGTYGVPYTTIVSPQNGASIDELSVYIDSENDDLMGSISQLGHKLDIIPLIKDGVLLPGSEEWIEANEDPISKAFYLTARYESMETLQKNYGEHTLLVIAKDSENRTSYTPLYIEGVQGGGPEVTLRNGLEFSVPFDIYGLSSPSVSLNPDVILDVTSETGITSFTVKIISRVLTASELESLGLKNEMDLINPESVEMEQGLNELGFPTGADVLNATELELDITEFMPMLAELSSPGDETTFEFEIGHAKGTTSSEIITITRE